MMNYTYIEQLLDRFWKGETSSEEEKILKSFFEQNDVPEKLKDDASYFNFLCDAREMHVSDDFDMRFEDILSEENSPVVHVKAKVIPFRKRMMPFLQAAAAVAVVLTVGGAALKGLMSDDDIDFGNNLTSDTYLKAEEVKHVIETAQRTLTAKADSIQIKKNPEVELTTE